MGLAGRRITRATPLPQGGLTRDALRHHKGDSMGEAEISVPMTPEEFQVPLPTGKVAIFREEANGFFSLAHELWVTQSEARAIYELLVYLNVSGHQGETRH